MTLAEARRHALALLVVGGDACDRWALDHVHLADAAFPFLLGGPEDEDARQRPAPAPESASFLV